MINKEEVKYISLLARIELSSEEEEKLTKDLQNILKYFEKLEEVNTDNVNPLLHSIELPCRLRKDVPQSSLNIEDVFKNAPEKEEDLFTVPRVLDK